MNYENLLVSCFRYLIDRETELLLIFYEDITKDMRYKGTEKADKRAKQGAE